MNPPPHLSLLSEKSKELGTTLAWQVGVLPLLGMMQLGGLFMFTRADAQTRKTGLQTGPCGSVRQPAVALMDKPPVQYGGEGAA